MSDPEPYSRLQVFLARRGAASRRGAAEWIRAGRVTVNGAVTREPGMRIAADTDCVCIDGQPLEAAPPPHCTVLLHKPRGVICSAVSTQGRSVCDLVPGESARLVPAGRLDKDSEGLVVLSSDGDIILRLTHPRYGHRKRYRVTVASRVTEAVLKRLRAPLDIDGYRTRPAGVRVVRRGRDATELEFELGEGRNRQVRRICRRSGLRVERLVRISIGHLKLGALGPGQWRELSPTECKRLLDLPPDNDETTGDVPAKPSTSGGR